MSVKLGTSTASSTAVTPICASATINLDHTLTLYIRRRILTDYFRFDLLYVMNITDVDDPLFERAEREEFVTGHRGAIDLAFALEQDIWNGERYLQLSVADFKAPAPSEAGS